MHFVKQKKSAVSPLGAHLMEWKYDIIYDIIDMTFDDQYMHKTNPHERSTVTR